MGSGHIEQLSSGTFRAIVYGGKDPITGKKVYLKETHANEVKATEALGRLLAQVEAESHPDRAATVATLMEAWSQAADHELNTSATNEVFLRRVILPALGDMPLRKLQHRVDILDRLYAHVRRCSSVCDGKPFTEHKTAVPHDCRIKKCKPHKCRPMAPSSVRRLHSILSGALGYAVSWGWIERNPAEYAHPPKLARRRARPPEEEQVARLLNLAWETDPEMGMFLWLATTLGARRGELAGLRWSKVDLKAAVIRIEANYVVRSGQRQLKSTKTDLDRRLSLDALTVQMLKDFREQRRAQLAPAHLTLAADAFVFTPDPVGSRPWHPDHFTHTYRDLADVLAIEEPLKNLRHFNATQLLAAGVDLRTTAGRLGHSDGGATTLRVYADWMPATDRRAAEQLSGDLAALRAIQAEHARSAGYSTERPPSTMRPLARPIAEILDPPRDGKTTYLDVAEAIRGAIGDGRLRHGDPVPTVTELAQWYGLARSTAQRAISHLACGGYTTKAGGRWAVTSARDETIIDCRASDELGA